MRENIAENTTGQTNATIQYLMGILLFISFFSCFWHALGLGEIGIHPLLPLAVGCIYSAVGYGLPHRWRFVAYMTAAIPAVLVTAGSRYVSTGWNIAANQVFLTFENYIGRILPRYEIDETMQASLCAALFLSLSAMVLAFSCGRATGAKRAWRLVPILLALLLWMAALLYRAPLPSAGIVTLIVTAIFQAGSRLSLKKRLPDGSRFAVCFFSLVAILSAAAAMPLLLDGSASGDAEEARHEASRVFRSLRYEWNGQILPEGDFNRITDYEAESAASFYSAGEGANAYYFRGFVGEVYTSDGWRPLASQRKAEYATLFAWLHDRGFYGQVQYALLAEALGFARDRREIQIDNTGASTGYRYAPYEVAVTGGDKGRIGDENLLTGGLRGETGYSLALTTGAMVNDDQLYRELTDAYSRGAPAATRYLTGENAYRGFVYENYLDMPKEARASIERFFTGLVLPDGRISFSDAKQIVNTYLNLLGYAEAPEMDYTSGDMLVEFLEKSKEGNSAHLATATVMMFRYLGIPARYVEGFRFTQGDMEAGIAWGAVDLSDGTAQAWAEIYRDGIGFVPFTMIPPEVAPPEQQPRDMDTPMIPPEAEPPSPPPDWHRPLLWLAVIICALLLLAFFILAARRALKRWRLMKHLSIADNAVAVSRITAYMIGVLVHTGIIYKQGSLYPLRAELESRFGKTVGMEFIAAIQVQQAALFSGRPVDDEGRASVNQFLEMILDQLRKQPGLYKRLSLKWIYCVY